MKAYKIQSQLPYPGYSVRMTTVFLPFIRCDSCGRQRGEPSVYHPTIECPANLTHKLKLMPEYVSVEEFVQLRNLLPKVDEQLWDLAPASQLGTQRFLMDAPPPDFLLDMNCSLISEKALAILEEHGLHVYTGRVEILCGRKPLEGWRAVDFPDLRLLSERAKKTLGVQECPRCGKITTTAESPPPSKLVQGHTDHELVRAKWPPGLGMARIRESGWRVAAPELIAVWNKHKLAGIRWVEIGKWV